MLFLSLRNLRFRLILLICIALAPALMVGGFNIIQRYNHASTEARQQARNFLREAEADCLQLIESSRQFLYL
ncbi:MAG: hypothetical protein AAGU11_11975, partial [Syntrophobacteraceae bacterium]